MRHEFLHGFPVLDDYILVGELFPDCPGNDHSCIGPSQAHHVVSVLGEWCDSRESSHSALAVTHVTGPFMEEGVGVGEEGSGLREDLGVGCPT